jgi:hypothetical protein
MKKRNLCCKNVLQYNFLLLERSICYFVFVLLIIFRGDRLSWTLLVLCHVWSTYIVKPLMSPPTHSPSFKSPSANSPDPRSDTFGNFLRRLAFALASTFLYATLSRWYCVSVLYVKRLWQSNEFSSAAVDKTFPSRDENVVQRKYKHRRQCYFVCVTEMGWLGW